MAAKSPRLDWTSFQVFSTCPQSFDSTPDNFLTRVVDVAKWSEGIGCCGMLVYTDNRLVDPWLISQIIIQNTEQLAPLVAVQPLYMHPYTVANLVTSFAFMHGRRIFLNMLAGGFKNDLLAFNDTTPHDNRYLRTTEYTSIILGLLQNPNGFSYSGKYYQVKNLRLTPSLPTELHPGVLLSGSSPAGMAAAVALGATAIKYPQPPGEETGIGAEDAKTCGIRVGIIARPTDEEAWRVALQRFPEDRKGRLTHKLAMSVSDSHWHQQLSAQQEGPASARTTYWLGPFHNYKTFCPYLVGDYDRAAAEVAKYGRLGYRTFVLDIPPNQEDLYHTGAVFERAERMLCER